MHLSCDFFVYKLPFWRNITLKVPKIYLLRLCIGLQFRTVAYTVHSNHGLRNTRSQIGEQICGITAVPMFAAGVCIHCGRHVDDCHNGGSSISCGRAILSEVRLKDR